MLGLTFALLFLAPAVAAQPTSAPVPRTPEERLWADVQQLMRDPDAADGAGAPFDGMLARQKRLLQQVRLYQSLYPGGTHRQTALQTELQTLHSIGSLENGNFEPLCRRVDELLASQAAATGPEAAEAAYWSILCRRLARQPTPQPQDWNTGPDDELLAAYRDHLARFPDSPYAPRLASLLFEAAARRGATAEMGGLVDLLTTRFPDHALTARLAGTWRRMQATGQPFSLCADLVSGARLDTREWYGEPVLIVVWDSNREGGRQTVQEIERFRQAHPALRVVGVGVHESREWLRSAVAELHLDWPQVHDPPGPAGFAQQWGVTHVPFVFVIDRAGRLAGTTADESWRPLAEQAIEAPEAVPLPGREP